MPGSKLTPKEQATLEWLAENMSQMLVRDGHWRPDNPATHTTIETTPPVSLVIHFADHSSVRFILDEVNVQ